MGDSDEENYVSYGTPLDPIDEDELPRKKPILIHEQIAVDEYGRRRFHGAFTGGFSAGYFNTVGTRDGWKPQQFKSSRSRRHENISQRPEDFMDEEDTGEFGIAPTGIRATRDFADDNKRGVKRERFKEMREGPIPGVPVLQNILKPVKTRDRIGVTILKKMGWKPGQGVGPRLTKREKAKMRRQNDKMKIYTCEMPSGQDKDESDDSDSSNDEFSEITFAPDDYEPFRVNPKDNYFGIGYSGLDKRPVLSNRVSLFDPPTFCLQVKSNKFSVRGQAFGVGAFEDDDEDIYARDDMSQYDFTLGQEKEKKSRWNEKEMSNSSGCLEGFIPAKNPIDRRKVFPAPIIPKDFQPIHVVRKSRFFPPIEPRQKDIYGGQNLNAVTRAAIIGESSNSSAPQFTLIDERANIKSDNLSVASKMIKRTLNLNGKEKVTERRNLEEERKLASASANSWMNKLYTSGFVQGETMGTELEAQGSLQNLNEFKGGRILNEDTSIEKKSTLAKSDDSAKPFLSDPDKQRRFEQYQIFKKNGEAEKLTSIQPLSMNEWDRNRERFEFEQALRLFGDGKSVQGTSSTCSSLSEPIGVNEEMKQAAKVKMFGKLTRQVTTWKPASIVCKRFNIAEPSVGCAIENEKKKFSLFDSLDFLNGPSKFEKVTNLEREVSTDKNSIVITPEDEKTDLEVPKTEKEKNFEATYEKVFGKEIEEKKSHSTMEKKVLEIEDKVDSSDKMQEKKDLFKAIFLSSSEDSDSEPEESVDSEVVKSVLIGKPSAEMNLQRNTSPSRGIFAKLDLDNLVGPCRSSNESKEGIDTSGKRDEVKELSSEVKEDMSCKEILPPNVYGPLPPSRVPAIQSNAQEEPSETPKFVFKSVVVPKVREDKGVWVEKSGGKKSKKEKKKHKSKDKERSRHKKKKSKKEKR